MQPAFFCVLKFSILKLKRKKKLKKKGIKEMNNGYEHMEEKTQDGVCFQWDESHEDIDSEGRREGTGNCVLVYFKTNRRQKNV